MHTAPVTAGMTTKNALLNAFYAVTDLTGEDMAKYIMENKDEIISPNWRVDFTEEQKQKIFNKIQANVKKYNGHSLSNGALMRISPLAIAYRNATPKELRRLTTEDTQITHSNPVAWDASAVYVIALAALLKGRSREEAYGEALKYAETDIVKGHLEAAKTHAIPVKLPQDITWKKPVPGHENENKTPEVTYGDDKSMGYLGVALQGAFYELLHTNSFSTGLESVIIRGGDTDTNGCIAAALLGAYFGVDEIPQEWIETVRNAEPYLGCRNKERTKISMEFLCIKDVDILVPQLANMKIN
uniref:ADP-ribosylhydrolase ARH3 n=1 Tax=Acrobeloides nanus TaxID=290746 RepID=A0A914C079_9BILA